jgi:SAM-dependent methyltransferase
VTGFDNSTRMLELARRRLGDCADLHTADLGSPVPFPGGAFDDVIASLLLHYLEDWTAPLAELHRVLMPGGRLIVAIDHPFATTLFHYESGRKAAYFGTYKHAAEWTMGGQTALMSFWHRLLHAMADAFTAAGFPISVISEPEPASEARELFPDDIAAKPPLPVLRPARWLIPASRRSCASSPAGSLSSVLARARQACVSSASSQRGSSVASMRPG